MDAERADTVKVDSAQRAPCYLACGKKPQSAKSCSSVGGLGYVLWRTAELKIQW